MFFFSTLQLKDFFLFTIKMEDSYSAVESFDDVAHIPSARRENLTDRFRQKFSATGRSSQGNRENEVGQPDLTTLTARSQVKYDPQGRISIRKSLS